MTAIAITPTQVATITGHVTPAIQAWWQEQPCPHDHQPAVKILSIHSDRKSGGLLGVSFRIELPDAFAPDADSDDIPNQWEQLEALFIRLKSTPNIAAKSFYAGLAPQSESKYFVNFTATLPPARGRADD